MDNQLTKEGHALLHRSAMALLENWYVERNHRALLIDGARQVGKTWLVREFGKRHYESVAEFNLIENDAVRRAIEQSTNGKDLFSRLTLFSDVRFIPGKTLIFIDEIQEAKEVVTKIKFLIEQTGDDYDYILSGSLLGVELRGVKSWPVGFMRIVDMYPLTFDEWCVANGISTDILMAARECCDTAVPVDSFVHERLLDLFYYYLAIGGMPQAVQEYVDDHNIQTVRDIQADIVEQYRHDITKYCPEGDALYVRGIFDLVPVQLNSQTKRYIVSRQDKKATIERDENRFLWLANANVALPVYNVDEPRYPLQFARRSNLFKLFLLDVGLLGSMSGMQTVRKTLLREATNYGAMYENFVAQELVAHGKTPYYYRTKKYGELDFVIDSPDGDVLPIEVKSGKDYKRHTALDNVLAATEWGVDRAVVLHDGNVERSEKRLYLPIYAAGWLSA